MLTRLPPRAAYTEPFAGSDFAERLAKLRRGRVRVAYYYDYPDSSTFRYRVYNMIQALEEGETDGVTPTTDRSEISASWFCYADNARLMDVVESADVLVICRARYTHRINEFVTRGKNLGCTVLFDCDDLVFDPSYVHLLAKSLDQDLNQEAIWDFWFGYVGRIAETMRLCDGMIVTNAFLAKYARAKSGKPVFILPNFLNREQILYSKSILNAKVDSRFSSDGRIHIGYFSGSPSHNRDFAVADDGIAAIMNENKRVNLRVGGYLDVTSKIEAFGQRVERFPMQDYVNLQNIIGSTEINIAPLQNNIFTNCKSELKYFEAAIVGTPTIASPTYLFKKAITDGQNGWLAQPHEWADKIAALVEQLDTSRDAYIETALLAANHAAEVFQARAFRKDIEDVLLQRGKEFVDA